MNGCKTQFHEDAFTCQNKLLFMYLYIIFCDTSQLKGMFLSEMCTESGQSQTSKIKHSAIMLFKRLLSGTRKTMVTLRTQS